MKKVFALVAALALMLAGCGETDDAIDTETLYNQYTAETVSLGMTKAEIEDVLGTPTSNADGIYSYGDVSVQYADGKSFGIATWDDDWIIRDRLSLGMTRDDIYRVIGEPEKTDTVVSDDVEYYSMDKYGERTESRDKMTYILAVGYNQSGEVFYFYLYYPGKK